MDTTEAFLYEPTCRRYLAGEPRTACRRGGTSAAKNGQDAGLKPAFKHSLGTQISFSFRRAS